MLVLFIFQKKISELSDIREDHFTAGWLSCQIYNLSYDWLDEVFVSLNPQKELLETMACVLFVLTFLVLCSCKPVLICLALISVISSLFTCVLKFMPLVIARTTLYQRCSCSCTFLWFFLKALDTPCSVHNKW